MDSPYIGEIRMFAGNFAPVGWAFCDGSLLPISENDALFTLIGTTYGGDGLVTFAVPDLRGRLPVHMGAGPAGNYVIGQMIGVEEVTLTTTQIPNHSHTPAANTGAGNRSTPVDSVWAASSNTSFVQFREPGSEGSMAAIVQSTGGSRPHNNMPPYLAINFIISLFGIFPSPT